MSTKETMKEYLAGMAIGIVLACGIAACLAYAISPSHNWCINHPSNTECTGTVH